MTPNRRVGRSLRCARVFRRILTLTAAALFFGTLLVAFQAPAAVAANASDFNAGNIIDDATFYDSGTMTVAQIQSFLNAKVPTCTSGYTCLKNYTQKTPSMSAHSGYCAAYAGSPSESAAYIIYKVATACGINPQVLIVLLQKEQGLVTSPAPTATKYAYATGLNCPDSAGCDPAYAGFFNQLYGAAYQFLVYRNYPYSFNYVAGRTNTILYNPNKACGSSRVFIQNQATAGLYDYTPYRPNSAALNNLYSLGDICSTYGNRNFWRYFTDWFGQTHAKMNYPIFGVGDFNGDGKPDLLARRPNGTLWFYAGTGTVNSANQGYKPAVQIGRGWDIYDEIIGVGDFNGDGKPDLVARKPDGTLWFYAGTGTVNASNNGYLPAIQIGLTGWDAYTQVIGVGDFNGDGKADLLARKPDGTLWFYAGTGVVNSTNEGYLPRVQIGRSGWDAFTEVLGVGDLNRDGKPDLIGMRSDGTLLYYEGTWQTSGTNAWYTSAKEISAPGIASSDVLVAAGDMNSDGYPDLFARSSDGSLKFLGGTQFHDSGYAGGQVIGSGGWDAYTSVVGVGDFNGDGMSDLVAARRDGTLWFYAGTGSAGNGNEGYLPAVKIGRGGWNAYTRIVGTGDFNGDGKSDMIAVRQDGSLWLYAGTGSVGPESDGYLPAVKIGTRGWNAYSQIIAGDFNGDGKPDLLATRPDGTLWFYAGTQQTAAGASLYRPAVQIGGNGWNEYDALVGVGDFNNDGKTDFVARRPDGTLWFYAGTGNMSGGQQGYLPGAQIGHGWNVYAEIVGTQDFNGDRLSDLVGIRPDGSLWFYAGTGSAGLLENGFSAAIKNGSSWNIYG